MICLAIAAKTQSNPIFYPVPFLLLDYNSKTGGMGETGVISTGNTLLAGPYHNPSLLMKSDKTTGLYISCLPQINKIYVNEFAVNILSFYKWNDKNVISAGFTYFDMGKLYFRDSSSIVLMVFQPNEYFINLSYAHKFNDNLSAGSTVKYIYSDLAGGSDNGGGKYFLPANLATGLMAGFLLNINEKTNLITNLAYQAEKPRLPFHSAGFNHSTTRPAA